MCLGKTKIILILIIGFFLFLTSLSFASEYTVPKNAENIDWADIDFDVDIDIIIASYRSSTVQDTISIFINDGYGDFTGNYIEKENMHFMKCLRIDYDNLPDLLTKIIYNYQFVYYKNNGDGNFSEAIPIHSTLSDHYEKIAISDINNDGDNDIIFWRSGFDSYWGILHNNGYGEFTENIYYNTEANTMSLNVGKINDDEYDDVLIATTDGPLIFYNNLPEFNQIVPDSFLCTHIYSFDMDNDGDNDVGLFRHVFTGGLSCKLKILYNSGNGTFTYADTLFFPSGTMIKNINDFNNDGYPDLVYTLSPYGDPGESIYVTINNQDGTFSESSSYYIGSPLIFRICSADFDNNCYNDLAITGYSIDDNYDGVRILFNDGTGEFVDEPQTGIEEQVIFKPELYITNYPNPFNPETTISFSLSRNSKEVELNIYNIKGELIINLMNNKVMNSGKHFIQWDGKNNQGKEVSTNVYLYTLRVGDNSVTKKMLLVR